MALLQSESKEMEEEKSHGITAIAIASDRNSHFAVKWAVENLLNKKTNPSCFLVHVQSKTLHPDDLGAAPMEIRPPSQQELQMFFLPFRGFCARKGIQTKEVVLHDIDAPTALVDYIKQKPIDNLVVGACNRNALTRKFCSANVPGILLKSAPESCAVYVIAKGKVQASRAAIQSPTSITATTPRHLHQQMPTSNDTTPIQRFEVQLRMEDLSHKSSKRGEGSERLSCDRTCDSVLTSPGKNSGTGRKDFSSMASMGRDGMHTDSLSDDHGEPLSIRSTNMSSEGLKYFIGSGSSKSFRLSRKPNVLEEEVRRLKLQLKQSEQLYNTMYKEATLAKQMARELQQLQTLGEHKLQEARLAEQAALALAEAERQKSRKAIEAAEMAQRIAEMEAQKRKKAELRMKCEENEKKKLMETLTRNTGLYRRYNIDEIEVATDFFAASKKIGEGGYGPVYKGVLNHTTVAIKVLRPGLSRGQKQFLQEVEFLSTIRHPHMVMLVGACPEYGCLVYEYMDNGSLEDRLFRNDNTPSIPWRTRFRIASEIATALLFLHERQPEPLVHRDLKPANILLDRNFVSKIGDVGLARLIPSSTADNASRCHLTTAAGTLYYIDPEYQQTGKLSIKSDLYSLGIMLLQIITAKAPMGLSHEVQESIENGTFSDMLDPTVTDWPKEEALALANVALNCCQLRKKDRPDLASVVLPELLRLRDLALADESDELAINLSSPFSNADAQVQMNQSQIKARRKWKRRLMSMNKIVSCTSSSEEVSPRAEANQAVGRSKPRGCWSSFVSSSTVPHAHIERQ